MKEICEALEKRVCLYRSEAAQAAADADRPDELFRRMLGAGRSAADSARDRAFFEDIHAQLEAFGAAAPNSTAVREVMELIFSWPQREDGDTAARWTLLAAQGPLAPLVVFLSPEDARALNDRYTLQYPKRQRFPTQEALARALAKRAAQP